MGIFDIFKKKSKIDADIKKSMDDFFRKTEQFKYLKKGELSSIPDSDLRTAVMSWMWGKFNKDWTNQYEVIESLPKPCQDIYSCCTVVDEINNGGLNQLFFNSTGQFVKHGGRFCDFAFLNQNPSGSTYIDLLECYINSLTGFNFGIVR